MKLAKGCVMFVALLGALASIGISSASALSGAYVKHGPLHLGTVSEGVASGDPDGQNVTPLHRAFVLPDVTFGNPNFDPTGGSHWFGGAIVVEKGQPSCQAQLNGSIGGSFLTGFEPSRKDKRVSKPATFTGPETQYPNLESVCLFISDQRFPLYLNGQILANIKAPAWSTGPDPITAKQAVAKSLKLFAGKNKTTWGEGSITKIQCHEVKTRFAGLFVHTCTGKGSGKVVRCDETSDVLTQLVYVCNAKWSSGGKRYRSRVKFDGIATRR